MDTTASSMIGADDEREEDDEEEEEEDDDDVEAELAALNRKRLQPPKIFSFAAVPMATGHPNTPTSGLSSSNVTPQPSSMSSTASGSSLTAAAKAASASGSAAATKEAASSSAEESEARDSFHPDPQQPRSLPYHRPVPVLQHLSLVPPPRSLSVSGPSPSAAHHHHLHHHHKYSSPNLLLHHHHHLMRPLPSPQTPSQPHSLQLPPSGTIVCGECAPASAPVVSVDRPLGKSVAALSSNTNMSRSISDSTLRRAALHLNLSQSVLPSFTSLQQFKV